MAQRRPLASHPAFVPLIAAWLGALGALVALVAPIEWLVWTPFVPGVPMRATAAGVAGLAGVFIGYLSARIAARRHRLPAHRSLPAPEEAWIPSPPAPRPLRINEEVASRFEDAPAEPAIPLEEDGFPSHELPQAASAGLSLPLRGTGEVEPLARIVDRFDRALDAYARRVADQAEFGPDAVQRFVATQTGTTPNEGMPSGPDHQAELRKALDKLAQLHGRG